MKKPKYIVIHHSSVSRTKNADQFKATNAYHKQKWNFKSSLGYYGGYNYEVSASGKIRQFRKDGERTAAQYQAYKTSRNLNDGSAISIMLDGNFDVEKPTLDQIESVRQFLKSKMDQYDIPKENVIPHRAVATYKSCPGWNIDNDVYEFFKEQIKVELVRLELYKQKGSPEVYILGRDKKYHHIADESTWYLFFDGFYEQWNEVDTIKEEDIGYPLVSKY